MGVIPLSPSPSLPHFHFIPPSLHLPPSPSLPSFPSLQSPHLYYAHFNSFVSFFPFTSISSYLYICYGQSTAVHCNTTTWTYFYSSSFAFSSSFPASSISIPLLWQLEQTFFILLFHHYTPLTPLFFLLSPFKPFTPPNCVSFSFLIKC